MKRNNYTKYFNIQRKKWLVLLFPISIPLFISIIIFCPRTPKQLKRCLRYLSFGRKLFALGTFLNNRSSYFLLSFPFMFTFCTNIFVDHRQYYISTILLSNELKDVLVNKNTDHNQNIPNIHAHIPQVLHKLCFFYRHSFSYVFFLLYKYKNNVDIFYKHILVLPFYIFQIFLNIFRTPIMISKIFKKFPCSNT